MDTVTISIELFEQLTTAAEVLARGARLNAKERETWRALADEAKAIHNNDPLDFLSAELEA